jgi:FMN-dependent NADH-azoreductase
VPEEHVAFVAAELTVAGLMPHLARFREAAADALAAARAEVTALASARTEAAVVRSGAA